MRVRVNIWREKERKREKEREGRKEEMKVGIKRKIMEGSSDRAETSERGEKPPPQKKEVAVV